MRNARYEGLAERLLRAGVAPRHVYRTVFELQGHFEDLVAEFQARGRSRRDSEAEASDRLGSEDVIVASVLARPELRSRARRWPWAGFAIFPAMMFAATLFACMFLLVVFLEVAKYWFGHALNDSAALQSFGTTFLSCLMWAAPISGAAIACLLAVERRAPPLWPVVGIVLISLVGSLTNANLEWAPNVEKAGLGLGIGISLNELWSPGVRALTTICVALVLYLWQRHSRRHESRVQELASK